MRRDRQSCRATLQPGAQDRALQGAVQALKSLRQRVLAERALASAASSGHNPAAGEPPEWPHDSIVQQAVLDHTVQAALWGRHLVHEADASGNFMTGN